MKLPQPVEEPLHPLNRATYQTLAAYANVVVRLGTGEPTQHINTVGDEYSKNKLRVLFQDKEV